MSTLDSILAAHKAGTLLTQPIDRLYNAAQKVALYHDWGRLHPDVSTDAIPKPDVLLTVFNAIETAINKHYGMDGMSPVNP